VQIEPYYGGFCDKWESGNLGNAKYAKKYGFFYYKEPIHVLAEHHDTPKGGLF